MMCEAVGYDTESALARIERLIVERPKPFPIPLISIGGIALPSHVPPVPTVPIQLHAPVGEKAWNSWLTCWTRLPLTALPGSGQP